MMEYLAYPIILALYFAPTITAYFKKHPNVLSIFIINLLFGFTVWGWIGAFYYVGKMKAPGFVGYIVFLGILGTLMAIAWPGMMRAREAAQDQPTAQE